MCCPESMIVYGALAEAVRRQSALAVDYWFGAGQFTVWKWRIALGISRGSILSAFSGPKWLSNASTVTSKGDMYNGSLPSWFPLCNSVRSSSLQMRSAGAAPSGSSGRLIVQLCVLLRCFPHQAITKHLRASSRCQWMEMHVAALLAPMVT